MADIVRLPKRPADLDEVPGPGADCLMCEVRPISVCGALAVDELGDLRSISERRSFSARETIAHEGERLDRVHNLTSGVARVYTLLPDGRRQIVGFLLPGDFLGLAMKDRADFSADAVTRVTTCCFRRAAFHHFLDRKPHLLRRLHAAAAHELTVAQTQMVLLGRARAEKRILAFLLDLRDRWAKICGRSSVTIPLPMGRADIGDYLGLTIETVSRTMTQLERERVLVIVPQGVRLLDVAATEAMVGAA